MEYANGGVMTTNFGDYKLLRMSETPEIEVHIATSKDPLGGIGEPGVPPIAPRVVLPPRPVSAGRVPAPRDRGWGRRRY
jgi:hypothetical protein